MRSAKTNRPAAPLRLRLILAAERLVAKRGFGGVRVYEITEAAGALNASAIHYYYGSLDRLYAAVFNYRVPSINARRMALLEGVAPNDLRGIINAQVRPLADELNPRTEGNYYLRFLERASIETSIVQSIGISSEMISGWKRAETAVRSLISEQPKPITEIRLSLARLHLVSGLAAIEAKLESKRAYLNALPLMIEAITDATVALLAGPVSPQTIAALASPHKPTSVAIAPDYLADGASTRSHRNESKKR